MYKCPECGKELTQEMIDVNMCWECGKILDESLIYEGDTEISFNTAVEQQIQLENETKTLLEQKSNEHKLTTGNMFEGYLIEEYLGIVSGDVVIGTGFMSNTLADFADLFGTKSKTYANKIGNAKEAAIMNMVYDSTAKGGNAIIGVSFDYISFAGRDLIGVSVNGTSVKIKKQINQSY